MTIFFNQLSFHLAPPPPGNITYRIVSNAMPPGSYSVLKENIGFKERYIVQCEPYGWKLFNPWTLKPSKLIEDKENRWSILYLNFENREAIFEIANRILSIIELSNQGSSAVDEKSELLFTKAS